MAKAFRIALFSILFACTLAVFGAPVSGDHAGQSITVDGMSVHLGLMPAEVMRQHPVGGEFASPLQECFAPRTSVFEAEADVVV